jgi:RNA polymerase sigma-70 factor (ECF subfamily)
MTTDDQLMLDFQQGSGEAFSELFERYRDLIYAFFRRRLDHPARAEELTQECFVALLRNVARYEPRASFRSYLFGIAVHMVSAERRTAARDSASAEPLDGNLHAGSHASTKQGTDDAIWLRQALARLDGSEREIVMLREYEQLSYGEIAGLLHLPVNTVRSRLFRARMALKDQLLPAKNLDREVREIRGIQ